jgi:Anti-sigma factor NepR
MPDGCRWVAAMTRLPLGGDKYGGNRNKGDPVAKITKPSSAMIKGANISSNEVSETEYGSINFDKSPDGKLVSVSRLRKTTVKAEVADQIGLGLRSVYNDVLSQPVPDRFFDLLRQLESVPGGELKKDAS